MPEYLPVKPGEASELQLICGVTQVLSARTDQLEKRLKACGWWRQFRTMQSWFPKMTDALMDTMDPRKRQLFGLELSRSELRVYKKCTPAQKDTVTLSEDDVLWMITDELKNHCSICMGCGEDMRHCEFRRHLKGMTLFELDESGGVCMGKQIDTRNDI